MVIFLKRMSDWTDSVVKILAVPIGIGFILIVFITVLIRYVWQVSFVSSIELARVGFVWSCFLGATVCVKRENHIKFMFLIDRVGSCSRKWMKLSITLISIGFFSFVVIKGIQMVQVAQHTFFPALGYSQLWLYLPMPLCAVFMLIHSIAFLARDIKNLSLKERET
jgi:TRAP-type C4-dicarboxylate transport system permease small subunit